jgi:hypothetical protein
VLANDIGHREHRSRDGALTLIKDPEPVAGRESEVTDEDRRQQQFEFHKLTLVPGIRQVWAVGAVGLPGPTPDTKYSRGFIVSYTTGPASASALPMPASRFPTAPSTGKAAQCAVASKQPSHARSPSEAAPSPTSSPRWPPSGTRRKTGTSPRQTSTQAPTQPGGGTAPAAARTSPAHRTTEKSDLRCARRARAASVQPEDGVALRMTVLTAGLDGPHDADDQSTSTPPARP